MRRSLIRTLVPTKNPGSAQKEEAEIADAILADLTAAGETELIGWINRNHDRYMDLIRREYTELLYVALSPDVPLTAEAPRADGRTPLYGHTSPETAYFIPDYPGGFRKRLERRDWIEYKKGTGYRRVHQTRDKGSSRWNNPKPSTYSEWAANLYLDEKGHIQWMSLGTHSEEKAFLAYIDLFPRMDTQQARTIYTLALKKMAYYLSAIEQNKRGFTGWSINGVPQQAKPHDIERNQAELAEWEQIANRIKALLGTK